MPEHWKPSASDIAWSENLIRITKQGGLWFTTDVRSGYKFDHKNKTLTTVKNSNPELHRRIQVIFNRLGWIVEEGITALDPERN
jgi:hypothetical protein